MYAPTMAPMEILDNESLFNDQFLENDGMSLLTVSPDEESINNQFPSFPTRHISQPSSASQIDEPQIDALHGVVTQFPDQLGDLDNSKACSSPFREQDLQEPWTAFNMGGDKASRPAVNALAPQYSQRSNRPASTTNVPMYQLGSNGNVMTGPRSDSGYGTHAIKSPAVQSATHSIFSGEPLAGGTQDCSSLTGDMGDITMNFQSDDLTFDQFPDYAQNQLFNDSKPSNSDIFGSMPESGPWICNTCPPDSAPLKNKSELK